MDLVSRRGRMALRFQEALTVAVRLRTNRQKVSDPYSFRSHIKGLLARADGECRELGYDGDLVRQAVYAYVAFLDESVLNSSLPAFSDWPKQPLQEEIFGDLMAGEKFYRNLQDLLGRQDAEDVADTLEVYQLCLLLGFRGRLSTDDGGQVRSLTDSIQAKVDRVRGGPGPLSLEWMPPGDEVVPASRDPWVTRLARAAMVAGGVMILLFLVLGLALRGPVGEATELARQIVP